jgi:hypothetical protein
MNLPADHLTLLRRFEPAIRFTRGEQFFPTRVEDYVAECCLWMQKSGEAPQKIANEGELNLENLGLPRPLPPGAISYLQLIEPLNVTDMAAYALREGLKKKDARLVFKAGRGRLARVGYLSRFVDAIFSISLLARGRVPGDRAAAAALTYHNISSRSPGHVYYGRVVQQSGWIVLQYWYFYVFNNWRSRFYGVNDHEADWEMVNIYLYQAENGDVLPEWLACASHDFSGDDLRRRWDDPEVEKVGEQGEHPIIYAAAGSHASYFSAGEYLTEMEVPFLASLMRAVDRLKSISRRLMRKVSGESGRGFNVFRVPFVDYARGDGSSIGEGQEIPWDAAVVLDPVPAWVNNYRGLWGFFARDPVAGENAPAGPYYTREGGVRRAWYDPVGWAGLDKVPTPGNERAVILERRSELQQECLTLLAAIEEKQHALFDLGVEASATRDQAHLRSVHAETRRKIASISVELNRLRAHLAEIGTLIDALGWHAQELQLGRREPARSHIQRAFHRDSEMDLRLGRLAELWAAASIGITLIAFIAIAVFASRFLLVGMVVLLILMALVEAGFRRRLSQFIASITNALAVMCGLVLFYQFFWFIVIALVVVAGGYMVWENLRELWR